MTYNWEFPYSSQRSPVFAENVVATSQPLAVESGIAALRRGGNAVDAALSAAITLTVTEPNNNGIGSDAFALIWDGSTLHGLNASGRAPAAWNPGRFDQRSSMPQHGWDSVTVPGAVSAWVAMSERFGQLAFHELFEDAIRYATNGYPLGHISAPFWALSARLFADRAEWMRTFTNGGRSPEPGDWVRLPDHARTLQEIASTRGQSFYRGRLADVMVADCIAQGGGMDLEDLNNHQADWVEPIRINYRDITLHEIPPSGQGLIALITLGILEKFDLDRFPVDSVNSVHLQVEAFRQAYAVAERHLSDIEAMQLSPEELLSNTHLSDLAKRIQMDEAATVNGQVPTSPDTVYLTTADSNGLMVSMIQSNFRGFGSGIVVPGTGIALQNRGSGFTLEKGHPNEVGGGKRPYHTIIPGFVTRNGSPLMSFGVMGGHMQAQGHVQMIVRMTNYRQNPQAASDAPRWFLMENGDLALESRFDPQVASALEKRGHRIRRGEPHWVFGGAQIITRLQRGYCAASDHRKEGLATGF